MIRLSFGSPWRAWGDEPGRRAREKEREREIAENERPPGNEAKGRERTSRRGFTFNKKSYRPIEGDPRGPSAQLPSVLIKLCSKSPGARSVIMSGAEALLILIRRRVKEGANGGEAAAK